MARHMKVRMFRMIILLMDSALNSLLRPARSFKKEAEPASFSCSWFLKATSQFCRSQRYWDFI